MIEEMSEFLGVCLSFSFLFLMLNKGIPYLSF